jgi:hypothetical protein
MIKNAFGENPMSESQLKLWYRCCKESCKSFASEPLSGMLSKSRKPQNVERVLAAINGNGRVTVRDL